MINIVSRSKIFSNVTGPSKVVENLIKGLEKLDYPYVVNKRLDYCKRLYIHDDRIALGKVAELSPEIRVLVGPNLYVAPRNIPAELDISKAVYLVPSEWNKRFWLHFGFNKCPMEAWPAGIDTDEFKPAGGNKEFILVYFKQRFDRELDILKKELEAKSLAYKILHYDKGYKEAEFKGLLEKSRYVIWLGREESQGIALEETLSAGVPILVCDVSSVGHLIGGNDLSQAEKDFKDTTSAEYFDDRCGIKIKDLGELPGAIERMESNFGELSLEGQARKLLGFYGKYFGLSYEAGFDEKPLREGDWQNAKRCYIFYLKLKHNFKMILVKLGIWKLIKG